MMASCVMPLPALAQRSARVPVIGFLGPASAQAYAPWLGSLKEGLRDVGYLEGSSLRTEFRYGDGSYEKLAQHAAGLVQIKVDVIVTSSTIAALEAKKATGTIPIVTALISD